MMRKLLTGLALASTALTTQALARDGAVYVEVDGGVMKLEDLEFDVGNVDNAFRVEPGRKLGPLGKVGYDFGAIVGYDFGGFRIEGEASYKGADADELVTATGFRVPAAAPLAPTGAGIGATGAFDDVGGDMTSLSFMLNALADFGPDDGLQFYAGGGVGYAKVDVNASINRLGPGVVDDSDWGFAWQAIAGVRAPLNETMDVGLKYRFFNAKADLDDSAGRDIDARWRSHSILGTFTFNFGGAEPPPPEPVMAPEPPPPPPPPPAYEPPPPPPPAPRPGERG